MFIECFQRKGYSPYLRLVETRRVMTEVGYKTKKFTLKSIGPLSSFDDGQPDFVKRLKESFQAGEPIIDGLEDFLGSQTPPSRIQVSFDLSHPQGLYAQPKNIGVFFLESLFKNLGISQFLTRLKSHQKLDYDLDGLTQLLVFGRVLEPDSKCATFEQRQDYLFPLTSTAALKKVYESLDVLAQKSSAIQQCMNTRIKQTVGRNTELCYYDVTNYFFEIKENDGDEEGQEGLRKKGVSKEHRPEPLVQMGLFIDDCGLPISYHLFPGNHTDATTLRPALKSTIDKMGLGRVIVVADGGLNSGQNLAHILDEGNGFIVSKSVKKTDKLTKAWILDEADYTWNDKRTFKVKSQIRERQITDEAGKKRIIREKIVAFWSRKHYERECRENAKFLEYLETVTAFPDKLKDKSKKIEKFLKKQEVDKETGEILKTKTHLSLDMKKIQEYRDLMGYYTLLTSEVEKSDEEIIEKYHGLSRIEDSFRITKSDLEGRPVYVRTKEHIEAHFLICFIALTLIRLLQYKVLTYQKKNVQTRRRETKGDKTWESGLTAERIQRALRDWTVDRLPDGHHRLVEASEELRLLCASFGVTPDWGMPLEKNIRQLRAQIMSADNLSKNT